MLPASDWSVTIVSEMVKYFCDKGADVRARAWGKFFKDGDYGEFPLSFAVRMNCKPIIDYFLKGEVKEPAVEQSNPGKLIISKKMRSKIMRWRKPPCELQGCRRSIGATPEVDMDMAGNRYQKRAFTLNQPPSPSHSRWSSIYTGHRL